MIEGTNDLVANESGERITKVASKGIGEDKSCFKEYQWGSK